MRSLAPILVLLYSTFAVGQDISQNMISGQIQLSSKWKPVVYLSYIPNMNDRLTISSDMFIDEAEINENGQFKFSTRFLSEQDGLYRIHVSKRGHPKSSLIIGGRDQNYHFLIAKKNAQLRLVSNDSSTLFENLDISGYWPNGQLALVDDWTRFMDSTSFAGTVLKRDLVENAMDEKMRQLADTSSNVISGLYAIFNGHFQKNKSRYDDFYYRFSERWSGNQSQAYLAFSQAYYSPAPKPDYTSLWVGMTCFGMGLAIPFILFSKRSEKTNNPLRELSVQERKIYTLLTEGLSNKEISESCNIGVNTVKSHVSNIYSKLNVKSRKDILNINNLSS